MSAESFDLIVIGAGPGGYVAAIRAAQLGLNTAIVERYSTLGGTCLNVGCIPSKALLKSSEHFWQAKEEFSHHGIEISDIKLNLDKMIGRKNKVVEQITGGVDFLMQKNKITRILGHASFKDANTIVVEAKEYQAKNFIVATGSKPAALNGVAYDKKRIISSTEALNLQEIPKELIVIGGGVIGLEMGSVWARLGSKVTVIEYGDTIIPGTDKQIQKTLQKSLQELGMEFQFKTGVTAAEVKGDRVHVQASTRDGESFQAEADYVLVAIGRRPYTDNLALEKAGIELGERGFVSVNEHWQTKQKHIFAIGDVIGGMMLAHKAEDEGVAVAEIIAGKTGHVNYNAIPSVIYTFPEVATVGKTEQQLKDEKIPFNTGKFNFAVNGRAVASDEAVGFVKVLAHKDTDELLGVHMIGPNVSEMIAEATLALEYKAASEDVGITCHPHPTLSEALKEAALSATKRAIHGA